MVAKKKDKLTPRFQELTKQYAEKNYSIPELKVEKSNSIYYSMAHLKELMTAMKDYHANGIRIYFGEYNSNQTEGKEGQLGSLLVLTKLNKNGEISDLEFEDQPEFSSRLNSTTTSDITTPNVKKVLTFSNKPLLQMTSLEKIDVIKAGVSKNELEQFKKTAGLDYDQLAKALSVTRVTLINKKGKERFGVALSERIISIADVYAFGYDIFEDEAIFNRWILRPNRALGGLVPFELLDTQYGREEVTDIIGRIAHGIFS